METQKISPGDPRLTAYALGELPEAERAGFEQLLQQDPAAQQAVEDIRAAGALLADVLEHEPEVTVEAAPQQPKTKESDPYAKIVRFPYWMVSSLAAACFALAFIYWQRNQLPEPMAKHYIEVPLAEAAAAAGDAKAKVATEQVAEANVAPMSVDLPAAMPPPASLRAQSAAPMTFGQMADKDETVKLDSFSVSGEARAARTLSVREAAYGAAERRKAERTAGAAMLKKVGANQLAAAAAPARNESYAFRQDNAFLSVAQNPLSTFSADVDTASYANVRRYLQQGHRPPPDAVRIEELVNYFPYAYAGPGLSGTKDQPARSPFAAHLEVANAPWAPEHRLVRIGLKAREFSDAARPPANLVFLLDVSGSMNEPNKLPLVKQSLRLLVDRLRPQDRVAIAVYAGSSGLALPSTSAARKADILDAIDRLEASGSTNGAMGIQLAYDIAKANFIPGGANRVILATDGDFNVGVTSPSELVRLVGEKAQSGVFLTVLGFGMGNLKDSTLEDLADKGNGHYAYIDSLAEAKKTLVEQAGGTLVTVAQDVKLQVEFNPAEVQAYRLIGYENRLLAKEDFNNDQVDAGEVGSGHTVTALYEIVPTGAPMPVAGAVDALKYQRPANPVLLNHGELLTVKIRYKEPAGEVSSKVEFTLADSGAVFAQATQDFKFAAAVAAFGMVLRDSPYKGAATLADVETWAKDGTGSDAGGYRQEFVELVELAQAAQ